MRLADLQSYIAIAIMQENVFKRRGTHTFSALRRLEYFYTLHELTNFAENHAHEEELSDEAVQELVGILAKRWERIQNTNSAYTQDSTNPANFLCLAIATELQAETRTCRFKLLMPTLVTMQSNITLIDLNELHIKPNIFVLSDDNTRFIEVKVCLEHFARTNEFRHTYINEDGDQPLLTEDETRRVTNHSDASKAYVITTEALQKIKGNEDSIGFALTKLMLELKKGSTEEGADEFVADEAAHVAVQAFSEVLSDLSESKRENLFKLSYVSGGAQSTTFLEIWQRLAKDMSTREKNAAHCVKNIAQDIDQFLQQNIGLFNIRINSSQQVSSEFSYYQKKYQEAKDKFDHHFPEQVVSYAYPEENESQFIDLIPKDIETLNYLFTKIKLHTILKDLTDDSKRLIIISLLRSDAGIKHLTDYATNFVWLNKLCSPLSDKEKIKLLRKTNICAHLYKAKSQQQREVYKNDLLELIETFEAKKAALLCVDAAIIDVFRDDPRIQLILNAEEAASEESAELAEEHPPVEPPFLVFNDEGSIEQRAPGTGRIVIDLTGEEEPLPVLKDVLSIIAHPIEDAMDLDENPFLAELIEEPAATPAVDAMDIDDVPPALQLAPALAEPIEQPVALPTNPAKKRLLSELDEEQQPAAVPDLPPASTTTRLVTQLLELANPQQVVTPPPAKKQRNDEGPATPTFDFFAEMAAPSIISTRPIAFRKPSGKQRLSVSEFAEALASARECLEASSPLKAFHFIK